MTKLLEPRDRLLAPAAVVNADDEVVGATLGAIVRRLLLFEEVILDTYAMRELPFLIDALGVDGLLALLESGALSIRADALTFGEVGRGGFGRVPLPLLNYSISPVVPA